MFEHTEDSTKVALAALVLLLVVLGLDARHSAG